MRVLLIAAVIACTALAGCAAGVEPMSAKTGIATAEAAAAKYVTAPRLVWIGGFEPFSEIMEDDFEVHVYVDGSQADGRAPVWAYGFLGQEGFAGVVVGAGLGVLADGVERHEEMEEGFLDEVGAVALVDFLDSHEVARILDDDERWPGPAKDAFVEWELEAEEEPEWRVTYETPDSWYEARVDARTGKVLEIEQERMEHVEVEMEEVRTPEGRPGFEARGSVTAEASPGPMLAEMGLADWCSLGCIYVPFEVPGWMTVEIQLTWGLETNDFDIVLFDEDGDQVASSGNGVPGTSEEIVAELEPGEYTLGIVPFIVAQDDYEAVGTFY